MRIALVEKLRLHLNKLVQDKRIGIHFMFLMRGRKIFNVEDYNGVEALNILASDISDLAMAIFNDIKPLYKSI